MIVEAIGKEYVVSYRNSTSNHNNNLGSFGIEELYLIEILHQTTTRASVLVRKQPLYLIEILHQTTTADGSIIPVPCCILSKFYIKPQHKTKKAVTVDGCILSKFYIKPQQFPRFVLFAVVVSYRNSTSNHNVGPHID